MKILHLLLPGLLGPWSSSDGEPDLQPVRVPALERLLARAMATRLAVVGAEATLFDLFGLTVNADRDLPVAAVTRLADGGDASTGWWLRTDPVHLDADLWQVLLRDARGLAITVQEAESLAAQFNAAFEQDGYALEVPHPCRWYLRLASDPGLCNRPLPEAIGQDINPFLPAGPEARRWRRLLTEIQMLFHGSEINRERENRGSSSINSVWFWGGGTLPDGARRPGDGVYADDPLSRGLARLADVPVSPLTANSAAWYAASVNQAETLVVSEIARFDRADDDFPAWAEHIRALERDWFSGCLDMLRHQRLARLHLYPCNGLRYDITPASLRRFWRRIRPLPDICRLS